MLFCLQVAHYSSGTRLHGCVQTEASRFFGLVEYAGDLVHLQPAGADLLSPSFPPAIALLPLAEMLDPDRRNSVHPCELPVPPQLKVLWKRGQGRMSPGHRQVSSSPFPQVAKSSFCVFPAVSSVGEGHHGDLTSFPAGGLQ